IGSRTGQVTITDSATGSPQLVSLKGVGTAVQLSTKSLTFSSTAVGASSAPQAVSLTNLGGTSLSITNVAINGSNSADFVPNNLCGSNVGAGVTCNINVTFKPTASGTRSGTLNIYDNG